MSAEIICPSCNQANPEGAIYCNKCATLLAQHDSAPGEVNNLSAKSPGEHSEEEILAQEKTEIADVEKEQVVELVDKTEQGDLKPEEESPKFMADPLNAGQNIGAGRDANVTNINNIINRFPSDDQFKIKFKEVSSREKNKVRSIFDPPKDYEEKLKKALNNKGRARIYFITGEEHAGKFTSAVNFGLQLSDHFAWDKANIFRNTSSIPDINSLSIYFRPNVIKGKSFYIITDIFAHGHTRKDFDESVLWGLQRALEEKDSYLIFTAEKGLKNSEYVSEIPIYIKDDLGECFRKQFLWWADEESSGTNSIVASVIKDNLQELQKGYKSPAQIGAFFNMINKGDVISLLAKAQSEGTDLSEIVLDENNVKQILDQIAQNTKRFGKPDQELARLWFSSLSANARLFAMLAVLLEGIDYHIVYDIYSIFTNQLREERIEFLVEPRQLGRDDLLTEIRAEVGDDRRIHYQDRAYWEQISSQLHNWYPLLWSLVDLLLSIANKFKSPEHWELRRTIGKAIARIGVHHPHEFKNKLTEIAQVESGPIVVIAGYAMEEACLLGVENQLLIIEILIDWVETATHEHKYDLEWAVAASVWRIYSGLQRIADEKLNDTEIEKQIRDSTEKLSAITTKVTLQVSNRLIENGKNGVGKFIFNLLWQEDQNDTLWKELTDTLENLTAIIFAIRQVVPIDSNKAINILKSWFESDNSGLLIASILSTQSLFEINSHEDSQMTGEQRYKLLELLQPALEHIQFVELKSILVESIFYSVSTWHDLPGWKEKILSAFTPIFDRANDDDLELLISVIIWHWLTVRNDDVQKAGMALLSRAYLISGMPIDLSGSRSAVLALDNSREAYLNRMPLIGANLYPRVQSRIHTEIISLGKLNKVKWEGFLPTESQLHWGNNTARIILPPLEKMQVSKNPINLLITIATDKILDNDDIADLGTQRKSLFLKVSRRSNKVLETVKQEFPSWEIMLWDERHFSFTETDRMVSAQIAKDNLDLDQQSLWNSLQSVFNGSSNDLELLISEMLTLAEKIDAIESLSNDSFVNDYISKFTSALLYIAKQDFEKCLHFIDKLSNGSEREKILALTSIKLLFKTYAHLAPTENNRNTVISLLMFAQAALPKSKNWDLIKCVLSAIENWSTYGDHKDTQPTKTVKEFSVNHAMISETRLNLSYTIASNVPYSKKQELIEFLNRWINNRRPNELLKNTAKQILTYLSLGSGLYLPDILSDQRFGLIFIDSKSNRTDLNLYEIVKIILKNLKESSLYPVVFRIGRTFPLAVGNDDPHLANISQIVGSSFRPPCLLAPIIEQIPLDKLGFVLLVGATKDDILDHDEWLERSVKQSQLFDYPPSQKPQDWPNLQSTGKIASEEEKVGNEIAQFVLKRMKGKPQL